MILISVVIPHFDDLEGLSNCVNRLAAQTIPRDQYEIIVADNNSTIGLEAVTDAVGSLAHVVQATKQGAGLARNVGVAHSCGSIICFIDSDCSPRSDWLERGMAALKSTDIVGGRVDIFARYPTKPTGVEAFEMATAFPVQDYIQRKNFAVTANLFVRRSDFDRVGEFRSKVAEDMDWCRRAVSRGLKLSFGPDVVVAHPARESWDELKRKWARTTAETFTLTIEQTNGRLRWAKQCFFVLASIGPHTGKFLTTPLLPSWIARLRGIGILIRIRLFRFWLGLRLLTGFGKS